MLKDVISFDEQFGSKPTGTAGRALLGPILVLKGQLGQGLALMGEARSEWIRSQRKFTIAFSDYNFGKIYAQLAGGGQNVTFSIVAKNIGFLIKNIPFAARKAEACFQSAIRQWTEIGSPGWVGRASLDLGRLYKRKGRKAQAKKHITESIRLFEECEADGFLKQAKAELASLG